MNGRSLLKAMCIQAFCCLLIGMSGLAVWAEVQVVTAEGEHRLGLRDTREDAIRLAADQAKRHVLEQIAVYVENETTVQGFDMTRDEIRTYTAGVVLVLDQQVTTYVDGDDVVVRVEVTAQVDADEVREAVLRLRDTQDARQELTVLKSEVEQLHHQLDEANQQLAGVVTPDQVQMLTEQRQHLLDQVESNGLVAQAWTDWVLVSPTVQPSPWVGLAQAQGLLAAAQRLYPTNPHITIMQHVLAIPPQSVPPHVVLPPRHALAPALPHYGSPLPPTGPPRGMNGSTRPFSHFHTLPPPTAAYPPGHALPPTLHQASPVRPPAVSRAPFPMPRFSPPPRPSSSGKGKR